MLLFFAFQHPRWQISLAQFKIFSLLKLVYFFFLVFFSPSCHLRPLRLMSIYRVTSGNELTGWMTVYMDRVRDSTSVCNLVGTQSIASLIKSSHSSPDFSIIVLISLLCALLYHSMGCYSDYLCNKNQCLKFCSVQPKAECLPIVDFDFFLVIWIHIEQADSHFRCSNTTDLWSLSSDKRIVIF